jgi:hypothetical protein
MFAETRVFERVLRLIGRTLFFQNSVRGRDLAAFSADAKPWTGLYRGRRQKLVVFRAKPSENEENEAQGA